MAERRLSLGFKPAHQADSVSLAPAHIATQGERRAGSVAIQRSHKKPETACAPNPPQEELHFRANRQSTKPPAFGFRAETHLPVGRFASMTPSSLSAFYFVMRQDTLRETFLRNLLRITRNREESKQFASKNNETKSCPKIPVP